MAVFRFIIYRPGEAPALELAEAARREHARTLAVTCPTNRPYAGCGKTGILALRCALHEGSWKRWSSPDERGDALFLCDGD